MIKAIVIASVLTCFFISVANSQDSVRAKPAPKIHHPYPNPRKALVLSAILPGAGQFYNKKYWKIPILYAGIGTITYFIVTNQQEYDKYNSALKIRVNGGMDPYYNIYSTDELNSAVTYYHRLRDISIISMAAVYLLNIVDANVDANLHGFDVSDDISLHIINSGGEDFCSSKNLFSPGLKLTVRF